MIYAFIGYLAMIFFFLVPVSSGIKVSASLNSLQAGGSFKLSAYRINFSIKIGQEGWEIQSREGIQTKIIKESEKTNLPRIKIDRNILSHMYIDKAYITFLYGSKNDAYNTSVVCNAVNMFGVMLVNAFSGRIKDYKSVIRPTFDRDNLHLQVKVSFKVNFFIIFSTLIKIITLKIFKNYGKGGRKE